MSQLSGAQQQAALAQFTSSPAFLALAPGKDRYNAYVQAYNAVSGDTVPTAGSGLFQGIPGQSDLETAITRAIGIGGGAVVAGGLVAGAGAAGAGGAGAGAGTTAAAAPAATAAATSPSWLSPLLIPAGLQAATSIYGMNKQSDANTTAAELQAKSAADALAFEKQQAAQAQQNYLDTQTFNRGVYQNQQNNLAPYRAIGAGSLAELGRPIGQ